MEIMKLELNEFDIELAGHQIEIFYYNSKKYNGIVFENFNGKIATEFNVKNGLKNGTETVYFNNGNIECISEYKNGLLDGSTKIYYETGELQEESIFEYGICVSHKLYSINGSIKEEFTIDKNSFDYKSLEIFRKNNK
jgi:antitoxin component YwqK of YwqJK toxin-antitoxin module